VDNDDPGEGVHERMASASEAPDRIEHQQTIRVAGQATSVSVQCECGGQLGSLSLPYASEEQDFHALCPECGTLYRRSLAELFSHTKTGRDVLVILPRARPRG
jgi:hypothetical protein